MSYPIAENSFVTQLVVAMSRSVLNLPDYPDNEKRNP
jgi:hypothetical protein